MKMSGLDDTWTGIKQTALVLRTVIIYVYPNNFPIYNVGKLTTS